MASATSFLCTSFCFTNFLLMIRQTFGSNSPWEGIVGYSRVVRVGNIIEVSGTVAVDDNNTIVAENDAAGQTRFILDKIIKYVEKAGGRREDIARTRIFVTDISRWEEVGKVHGEFFAATRPVTSMVEVSSLISSDYLVEIEATAIIPSSLY